MLVCELPERDLRSPHRMDRQPLFRRMKQTFQRLLGRRYRNEQSLPMAESNIGESQGPAPAAAGPSPDATASRSDPRRVIGQTLSGDVLEIGPGHDPFPVAPGTRVRYADRSVEGGRDKNWPELAGLPHGPAADFNINLDVDGLAALPDASLDALIACHVIEHLANPIAALREFERVLRPQGRLVLVLPDRNLTFDSVRQPAPLAHVLAKFHQGVKRVDDEEIRAFCSAIYYQPPMHPPVVREWHNPQRLDADRSSCTAVAAARTCIAGLPKSSSR